MKSKHYILSKNETNDDMSYINYKYKKGYKFKPKNNINYNGIKVNEMVLIKPKLVEKILKRKIRKQLDMYLQYIIKVLDEEDEDPSNLRATLNELTRYKKTIQNNYRAYLDERYVELLLKKIKVLEQELRAKLLYISTNVIEPEEKMSRRTR